jgi:hypothetical protein
MIKSLEQAILYLQFEHQRLKNDQTGKGSQIVVFNFQAGNESLNMVFLIGGILEK